MVGLSVRAQSLQRFDLPAERPLRPGDVTYSTLFGLGYAATPAAANLARGNFLRTVSPTRPISTASSNTASTPALSGNTALFGLDLRITPSTTGRVWRGYLDQLCSIGLYPTARFSGAPYQDTTLTRTARRLCAGSDQLDRFSWYLSGRNDWVCNNK